MNIGWGFDSDVRSRGELNFRTAIAIFRRSGKSKRKRPLLKIITSLAVPEFIPY